MFFQKEAREVRDRVIETLSKELDSLIKDDNFFEVPYDKELLRKLLKKYYVKTKVFQDVSDIKDYQKNFLTKRSMISRFCLFCAPELAKENNTAIDLPFFWCRGVECFHNSLDGQLLKNVESWEQYSLFHLMEILGYPKAHMTKAGVEPDKIVIQFVFVANKVLKKFNRLKCRICGHILYTCKKNSGYNLHNYYSCINPTCSEYNRPIYINYCYNCKTGLIDSRDSKKCPNGWYICPVCSSCCDDRQYERLIQRYIIDKRPVPRYLEHKLGLGHNDKGFFFCYKCGTKLINEDEDYWCPVCKKYRKRSLDR